MLVPVKWHGNAVCSLKFVIKLLVAKGIGKCWLLTYFLRNDKFQFELHEMKPKFQFIMFIFSNGHFPEKVFWLITHFSCIYRELCVRFGPFKSKLLSASQMQKPSSKPALSLSLSFYRSVCLHFAIGWQFCCVYIQLLCISKTVITRRYYGKRTEQRRLIIAFKSG